MIHRRRFLGGLAAALAAPAIIRTPGLLMPVKRVSVAGSSPRLFFVNGQEITAVAIGEDTDAFVSMTSAMLCADGVVYPEAFFAASNGAAKILALQANRCRAVLGITQGPVSPVVEFRGIPVRSLDA